MNAKKSWIFWILVCVVFAGVVWAFAHGAQLTDTEKGKGAAWIVGALAVMALEVFVAIKVNTKK